MSENVVKLNEGVMTYAELRTLQDKKESAACRKVENNVKNEKDGVRSGQCNARHGKKTKTFGKKTMTLRDIVKAGVDAQRKLEM